MIGNGLLAFAVLVVVALFVYVSLRFNRQANGAEEYNAIYTITLQEGFLNSQTEIHLNDSIILNQQVSTEPFTFTIQQFAPEGALLFVNRQTDDLAIFNIKNNGGSYTFVREKGKVKLVD